MALVTAFSAAVSISTNTKKVFDMYNEYSTDITSEGYQLWKMIDALREPLEFCTDLQRFEATNRYVDDAVQLSRHALLKCEDFIGVGDGDEDDNRPEDSSSWKKWFADRRQGVTRREKLPEMIQLIHNTIVTVNMCLTTISVQNIARPTSPKLSDRVIDQARLMNHEFETGRITSKLVASGTLSRESSKVGEVEVGHTEVYILKHDDDSYSIRFVLGEDDDSVDDIKPQRITRVCDCKYTLNEYFLDFKSVGKISAEVFSVAICMIIQKRDKHVDEIDDWKCLVTDLF